MTFEDFIAKETARWHPSHQLNVGLYGMPGAARGINCWIEVVTAAGEPLITVCEPGSDMAEASEAAVSAYYLALVNCRPLRSAGA